MEYFSRETSQEPIDKSSPTLHKQTNAAANALFSTTRRMINWENRNIEKREYNTYFEGLPSIGFTLVDHMGFLAPLQKQMLNTPKLFMVCKWSIDLNTITHKVVVLHQCASHMPFCAEPPAQRSCSRFIRLVSS